MGSIIAWVNEPTSNAGAIKVTFPLTGITAPTKRSLGYHFKPVKYSRLVPAFKYIALMPFSCINCCALATRCWYSSSVIGLTPSVISSNAPSASSNFAIPTPCAIKLSLLSLPTDNSGYRTVNYVQTHLIKAARSNITL